MVRRFDEPGDWILQEKKSVRDRARERDGAYVTQMGVKPIRLGRRSERNPADLEKDALRARISRQLGELSYGQLCLLNETIEGLARDNG